MMYLISIAILMIFFIVILVLLVNVLKYNKHMMQQETKMKTMDKTIESLQQKLQETNKRKYYRVAIPITECEFEFMDMGNQPVEGERKKGVVRDISLTGLRFDSHEDFPVRQKSIIRMFFMLNDEPLEIIGRVIRKDEAFGRPLISYGLEFMKTHFSKEEDLFRLIREVEVELRKKKLQG
ncbi:hypothetical protein SD70_03045 [Gordoniibacillus kamchatkensis]|uniref:PilZ domain-containing protein n=1 Tax=Gordoniibacillus kamchatkensis TaxID=1590651 RepID=A0ABR5AMI5_9BACL|nr:PilZ domain-containing protein [Paenibacillus sp. VKM B-2647]KIL42157.1 hypothetical protein SD70_03045 [Paenibacillus sp. VKM B-2647]